MRIIHSVNLQRALAEGLQIADADPVLLIHLEQSCSVIMSSEEFVRLKVAAGEEVPPEAIEAKGAFHVASDDPLGYDTSDLMDYARRAASTALSGVAADYSDAEVAAAERRWGLDRRE